MGVTRRRFLTTAATAAAVLPWLPGSLTAQPRVPTILTGARRAAPDLHELAARALEAAKAAGAEYADVRLTNTRGEFYQMSNPAGQNEEWGVGVRALVNGYWGFFSSAVWTPDEMARLGRGAAEQARANGVGKPRTVELAPTPPVSRGEWVMPVKYDPFDISISEKLDIMRSANDFAGSYIVGSGGGFGMSFERQYKVFASTEGSSWQQTLYKSACGFSVGYRPQYSLGVGPGSAGTDFMSLAGKGWEHITDSGLIDEIPRLIDEAEQSRHGVPVDVGMYDAVFSPVAMTSLINNTLGPAMQLDRAMGFEANAAGTSYISDPLNMIGSLEIGSKQLNITAGRSQPGAVGTVKWDDEGVEPENFTLVKNGVLNDFITTRESASWLKDWYGKQGVAVRSHGCSNSDSGQTLNTLCLPNLEMTPDPAGPTFEQMVSKVKKGIAVMSINPQVDQQLLNGVGYGAFREIVNGKLGRYIGGAGLAFRTPELLKNITAVGSASTQKWQGYERWGGQPAQRTANGVNAPAVAIKDVRLIDIMRKY